MPKNLVPDGPNLNLPGTREPDAYGHDTLASIDPRAVESGRLGSYAFEKRRKAWIIVDRAAFTHAI